MGIVNGVVRVEIDEVDCVHRARRFESNVCGWLGNCVQQQEKVRGHGDRQGQACQKAGEKHGQKINQEIG